MGVASHLTTLFRAAPSKRMLFRSLALGTKGGDRTVTSADGTSISVRCSGAGDPLVLVHGALDGIGGSAFVEVPLAERHAVWVYDRRGRGGSGDHVDHDLGREIDDLRAVLDAAGAPAHVVGHSYGAVVALAAAASGTEMRSLTLYEPPLRQDEIDADVVAEIRRLVESGEREAAIPVMAVGLAGASEDELAVARRIKPVWKALIDGAGSVPREVEIVRSVDWSDYDLPLTGIPVLVVRGGRDCSTVYPRPEDLPRFVTDPEVVTIPDQGHLALSFAPYDFARIVLDFTARH